MRLGKKLTSVLLVLVLMAVFSSSAFSTEIGDITANPSYYEGKEVTIRGTVTNSFWIALLTRGAYEITDDTGSIWVVASHTPPDKEAKVTVKGTVESAITIGDRSLGIVVKEQSRV